MWTVNIFSHSLIKISICLAKKTRSFLSITEQFKLSCQEMTQNSKALTMIRSDQKNLSEGQNNYVSNFVLPFFLPSLTCYKLLRLMADPLLKFHNSRNLYDFCMNMWSKELYLLIVTCFTIFNESFLLKNSFLLFE